MNKTTLDAVIEFKGEWPYVDCYVCVPAEDNDVAESGEFQSAKSKYTNEMWVNVCSERQFNTLVDELASNFGRHPYTYAECKKSWELTERHEKKAKPVYTQAQCDAGELPSVGMDLMAL